MTTPHDGTLLWIEDGCLVCPFCKQWTGLHLSQVSAGYHDSYDVLGSPCRTATFNATNGTIRHGSDTELNYSERRHWLELHFGCEHCDGGTIIFAQHKGATDVFVVACEPKTVLDEMGR
jgi:hypothetical protein